ncbi:hypothetical protein FTE28_18060 [Bacillus licheniformis]|nr:hypothetical protein FTE28_18060 [Bacillus licheniformis]
MRSNQHFIKTSWLGINRVFRVCGILFYVFKNGQKEQNDFKKLKIHKNQIIYFRKFFSYDDKKARLRGNRREKM